MALIKNEYDFYIDIPDDLDISWNIIQEDSLLDIDTYVKTISVKNNRTLVVLWGAERRMPVISSQINALNHFYHSIPNPMILINGGHFPSGNLLECAYAEIDVFRYASARFFKHLEPSQKPRTHKFLFASSKDYLSRRYLLQALLINGIPGHLAYKCDVTYHEREFYQGQDLNRILEACDSISHLIPITGFDSQAHFPLIPEDVINSSLVSIVMETYFNGPVYFSEKIYNSMLFNHMFIYLGPPHSLRRLRELGFMTFSEVIDESYDDITNDAQRLFAVSRSMVELLSKPIEELNLIHQRCRDILEHNRKLVLSYDISAAVTRELRSALSSL